MKPKTIVLTELQHKLIEENSKNKLQSFQRKIYLKAKQNPQYKFYCLYDKVFRLDTITEAYRRVKANKGKGGVDNIEFKDLEGKEEEFIKEIQQELKTKTYKHNKLKEIKIPKNNGKTRTLKIPTIKDRVVQMAVKLIIEPIFEADFKECSYGYRPKKSAHTAIGKLKNILFKEVYTSPSNRKQIKSIDLADCFNNIPHKELIHIIAQRIIDRQLLKLIKMFLKANIMRTHTEEDNNDNDNNKDEHTGTPQGGVISPLLANIYLDKIDTYWESKSKLSKMIRYADDLIITLHKDEEQKYQDLLKHIEKELKLPINHKKTATENIKNGVSYLGFTMKEKTSKNHKQYLSVEPSKKALKRIKEKIRVITKKSTLISTEIIIQRINKILTGWREYFDNIAMGKSRNLVNHFVEIRIARLLTKRNKGKGILWKLVENGAIHTKYGLYKMSSTKRNFT